MRQYIIYRNGSQTTAQRITAALAHYSQNNGALPAAVVVNPKDIEAATEHVKALDLALPVVGNGGVMAVECWLQVAEGGTHV